MQNFFGASASYAEKRATLAPESERQFWIGRAAADHAACALNDIRKTELIWKLRKNHCGTPAFAGLCENLRTM
jgi:hypothetical protein